VQEAWKGKFCRPSRFADGETTSHPGKTCRGTRPPTAQPGQRDEKKPFSINLLTFSGETGPVIASPARSDRRPKIFVKAAHLPAVKEKPRRLWRFQNKI
jgi:hypothetical protein